MWILKQIIENKCLFRLVALCRKKRNEADFSQPSMRPFILDSQRVVWTSHSKETNIVVAFISVMIWFIWTIAESYKCDSFYFNKI